MYIHLQIEESADGIVLLTGIDKNQTKDGKISCIDAKLEKVTKYGKKLNLKSVEDLILLFRN